MKHQPPPSEAEPVGADGFVAFQPAELTDMLLGAAPPEPPAEAADGRNEPPPPLSRSALFLVSLASQKDKAEAELQSIEAQIIQAEEIAIATERQARAECDEAIAAAKAKLERVLGRMNDDKAESMAALEASKDDILGVVEMLSGGIEAAGKGGAK